MNPQIVTLTMIANGAHLSTRELIGLARDRDTLYQAPALSRDKKGKSRMMSKPIHAKKKLLKRIGRSWNQHFRPHGAAHGGVPGKSTFTVAQELLGKDVIIVKRDISQCYDSIGQYAMYRAMVDMGYSRRVSVVMSHLFTLRDAIPTGSPLSSIALNVFLFRADNTLACECGRLGMTYCRFGDDLVVALRNRSDVEPIAQRLESVIFEHGLRINEKKRAECGLLLPGNKQEVLGIDVRGTSRTRIGEVQWHAASQTARRYIAACREMCGFSVERVAHYRASLMGYVHQCSQADISPVSELRHALTIGDRSVQLRLRRAGLAEHCSNWHFRSGRMGRPGYIDMPASVARKLKGIEAARRAA